jgi:hypothetical protein
MRSACDWNRHRRWLLSTSLSARDPSIVRERTLTCVRGVNGRQDGADEEALSVQYVRAANLVTVDEQFWCSFVKPGVPATDVSPSRRRRPGVDAKRITLR